MKRVLISLLLLGLLASLASAATFEQRYKQGYSLYTRGHFTEAIRHFRGMLHDDLTSDLSDNCQYWIGECYSRLKMYDQAIIEFDRVLTFPGTNKREDALYKIGDCHEKLGEATEARDMYLRLLSDYPDTRHASYVLKSLETLGKP